MEYGCKFTDLDGLTHYNGVPFQYNLPPQDEKWSKPTFAPNPIAVDDNEGCGEGRLHLMKRPSNPWGPKPFKVWFGRGSGIVTNGDSEKFGATCVELREISPPTWWRIIRFGWCHKADLSEANLSGADLRWANLSGAYLSEADLRWANLSVANLRGADLSVADLSVANLSWANLNSADLSQADLREAKYNAGTTWPAGFEPEQAGVVLVEEL